MRSILIVIIISFLPLIASAQESWDKVLDRYEAICGQCREMRKSVAEGAPVKASSVTRLLTELGRLRTQLQAADGTMTAAQRKRFKKIKDSYDIVPEAPAKQPRAKAMARPVQPVAVSEPSPRPRAVLELEELAEISCPLSFPSYPMPSRPTTAEIRNPSKESVNKSFTALAVADWGARSAFGVMGLYRWSGKTGAYLSFRSNFISTSTSYSISSSGDIEGGGYFWGNGLDRYGRWNATAGIVFDIPGSKYFSVYGGAGYGTRCLAWQDSTGNWARVNDFSYRGPAAEAGVFLHLKSLNMLAGTCWYGSFSVTAGLGLSF